MANYDRIALYYDLLWPRSDEVAFLKRLAKESNGPVLELGCGTGRLLIALAQEGFEVMGLDVCKSMLDRAAAKLTDLPPESQKRCCLQRGDMRCFTLDQKFGLVAIVYSTIMEFESREDRLRTFRCCRNHLHPRGILVVDSVCLEVGESNSNSLHLDGALLYLGSYTDPSNDASTIMCYQSRQYDPQSGSYVKTIFIDHVPPSGVVQREILAFPVHYVSPNVLETELCEVGFSQIKLLGGFGCEGMGIPYEKGCRRQIFIAQQ